MTINEYQRLAQRTASTKAPSSKIENGILGLCKGTNKIADVYHESLYLKYDFYRDHMAEELGDVCWYVAELAAEKLRKRYPDGFDVERSRHREE